MVSDIHQTFDLLTRVAKAVVATIGPHVELVVHDLRNPENCVVGLAGNLTKRQIGSPLPDVEFLPENLHRFTEDYLLYPTRTRDGRKLLSSTVFVRDKKNTIVGGLCINVDKAKLRQARDFINFILNETEDSSSNNVLETFAANPEEYIALSLDTAQGKLGKSLSLATPEDKATLVGMLDQMGVFRFRQAAEMVAKALGLSRASVYQYLKRSRDNLAGFKSKPVQQQNIAKARKIARK